MHSRYKDQSASHRFHAASRKLDIRYFADDELQRVFIYEANGRPIPGNNAPLDEHFEENDRHDVVLG